MSERHKISPELAETLTQNRATVQTGIILEENAQFGFHPYAMGLFSSLFARDFRDQPREKWDEINDAIHAYLAKERPVFFNACIEILGTCGVIAKNRTMTPRIELAIAVYQIHLGLGIIADRKYVRPEDTKSFLNMLYLDVCRYGSTNERDECIRRYWPQFDGNEIDCFYSDIATHITEIEHPTIYAKALAAFTLNRFATASQVAVATSFGDRKKAQKLIEDARNQK